MDWFDDSDKFAFVAMDVKTEDAVRSGAVAPGLWVLGGRFNFPNEWREWLGSIKAEEVESSNLLLMSKLPSKTPEILDGENRDLKHIVSAFYVGLLLSSHFATSHKPVILSGSKRNGELNLRDVGDFDAPVPGEIRAYPALLASEIESGARIGLKIKSLEQASIADDKWRLFRVIHLYQETRANPDVLDRLHQYARCIDGLILPDAGKTKQQFKSRTELFIGAHHDLMGEIYDVRSAVEHLHVNRYLETFDRESRLDLLKKEAIVEYVARTSIARVIENPKLWPHFANAKSLAEFWSLTSAERQTIWGERVDPMEPLAEYNPRYISDAMLGKQ
ncbi:hypothetical protein [Rhodoplanes sp. Z2-YC6860]|uniref:hypothetical protein n=1 Tax=Rhodoplanes sp. Z2-YC6860 TaxID=674703 RepID=UPI0012EE076B|nr:hypothetical protein [Rhodoplanes sp. Z2-YC6860]